MFLLFWIGGKLKMKRERETKIKQTKRGENYFYASENLIFHSMKQARKKKRSGWRWKDRWMKFSSSHSLVDIFFYEWEVSSKKKKNERQRELNMFMNGDIIKPEEFHFQHCFFLFTYKLYASLMRIFSCSSSRFMNMTDNSEREFMYFLFFFCQMTFGEVVDILKTCQLSKKTAVFLFQSRCCEK